MTASIARHPSVEAEISHELHIPVTGIKGLVYCLQKTPLTQEQQEYLKLINSSADRLLALESKLLAFAPRETILVA